MLHVAISRDTLDRSQCVKCFRPWSDLFRNARGKGNTFYDGPTTDQRGSPCSQEKVLFWHRVPVHLNAPPLKGGRSESIWNHNFSFAPSSGLSPVAGNGIFFVLSYKHRIGTWNNVFSFFNIWKLTEMLALPSQFWLLPKEYVHVKLRSFTSIHFLLIETANLLLKRLLFAVVRGYVALSELCLFSHVLSSLLFLIYFQGSPFQMEHI